MRIMQHERLARAATFDPLPALLLSDVDALGYFVRRDLLDEHLCPLEQLWTLPEAQKILKKHSQMERGRRESRNTPPSITISSKHGATCVTWWKCTA